MRTHLAPAQLERLIHDVNGLLASASLAAERLVRHEDPGVGAQARRISLAIDRVAEMVGGAGDQSKAASESGRIEESAIAAILSQIGSLIGGDRRAGRPSLEFQIAVQPGLTLRADHVRLFRILFNLAANAAAAVAENGGGVISVKAHRRGEDAVVTFADDGPGLPANVLSRFFPNAPAPVQATARPGGRIGLGLSNAMRFTEELGGVMTLEDTGAAGTRLTLTLPAAAPARPRA